MKDNKSFFIIKPESFNEREEIEKILNNFPGLSILETKILRLTEEDIDEIYLDDIGTELMMAIKSHLIGKEVEVGVVFGTEAVNKLSKICGQSPDPLGCAKGTIRREFGNKSPIKYNETLYFLNSIHKASEIEVEKSLDWFYKK